MSHAVAPWLPLWKPVVGGSIRAVGAFHTICWLSVWGLHVVSTVTISLVAGVGPARISVMMTISIISWISLVTLNNAPVALENLKSQREKHVYFAVSVSERRKNKSQSINLLQPIVRFILLYLICKYWHVNLSAL